MVSTVGKNIDHYGHNRIRTKNKLINGVFIVNFLSYLVDRNFGQRIPGAAGSCPEHRGGRLFLECCRDEMIFTNENNLHT